MTKVKRAVEKGEPLGFMKVVVDAETKQILGAAILGVGGDEVIHSLLDVMYARAPYTVIQRAVHIHPTVSELVPTMLGDLREAEAAAVRRQCGRLTTQKARAIAIASSRSAIGRSLPPRRAQAGPELVAAERSRYGAYRADDEPGRQRLARRADGGAAERSHQDPGDERREAPCGCRSSAACR